MSEKTIEDYTCELKRLLDDRPEQGWIFGVCATLARRTGWELWLVRLIGAFLLLSFTFYTALAYFCLAMGFHETRPGAQAKLMRWARHADKLLAVIARGLKNLFADHQRRRNDRHDDYTTPSDETNREVYGS